MAKKEISWKTKGMNRDLSVSVFSPEFTFENMNLRLETNEGNTLMSWVNEKGTLLLKSTENSNINLLGIPIGTAILNHLLIVFTHSSGSKPDYIYLLKYSNDTKTAMQVEVLYNGNLKFSVDHPLETLVSFETDYIQKVYWTDGLNQPRMINIAAPSEKKAKWIDTSFDFIPTFSGGKISVNKNSSGGGLFAPGVILYCFTYITKYGQLSNIVDVSPLFYLSHSNRGARPDEKVTNSFKITISEGDAHFDYVRLYSILRTSLDATPIVKILEDIHIEKSGTSTSTTEDYEYNSPLTLNYDTGSYTNLTLPVLAGNTSTKIYSVTASDGIFNVTVTPKGGSEVYDSSADMKFVAIADGTDVRSIISFLNFITQMVGGLFYGGSNSDCIFSDYYFCIKFTQNFLEEMQDRAEDTGNFHTIEWDFMVNGTRLNLDFTRDMLLYSYQTHNWYVVTSTSSVDIFTRKTVTVEHTEITGGSVYTDSGTTGAIIDPYELLYVGGYEISAFTMIDKDNTLFLGNCALKNMLVTNIQQHFNNIRGSSASAATNKVAFYRDGELKSLREDPVIGVYGYNHSHKWNNSEITTFKGGDTYRFGFQLQKKTGEWVEPVFIDDVKNPYYPSTSVKDDATIINLAYAKANIDIAGISGVDYNIYQSIRPVIVFPTIADREVLCQGVLNPTVFNSIDRIEKRPYALPSWYFRPYTSRPESSGSGIETITSSIHSEPYNGQSAAISPDYFIGKTALAYVLLAEIEENNFTEFIKSREVKIDKHSFERDDYGYIQEDYWYPTEIQTFWGAILLGEGDIGNRTKLVALLGSEPWEPQLDSNIHIDPDGYERDYSYVYTNCHYKATSGKLTFPIYNEMQAVNGALLYYVNPTLDPSLNQYHFKFRVLGDYIKHPDDFYDVTFIHVGNTIPTAFNSLNGAAVRFSHYQHLYSRGDMGNTTDANYLMKQIEILNAIDLYGSPFEPYDDAKNETNTEFFIDLSIVTLNSPDIDFDTNVQTYGNEDLKLRVIGAIPITACASAHDITTASAMLETGHNIAEDKKKITKFGSGELRRNVWHENSTNPVLYNSRRLVAEFIWNDSIVANNEDAEDKVKTLYGLCTYLIHPWHRTGSLNNDWRNKDAASSWLKTKKESNLLYSMYTQYLQPSGTTPNSNIKTFENIGLQMHLTENDFSINYRLPRLKGSSSDINYYPNIDKLLYNSEPYLIFPFTTGEATSVASPVQMKYKSTSHAVISLMANSENGNIPILPYSNRGSNDTPGKYENDSVGTTFWGDTEMIFSLDNISVNNLPATLYDFLWLGELYKNVDNPFGGKTDAAVRACTWHVGGPAVNLNNGRATICWTEGDTYYQRYDCLKTYPFTNEDPNQLLEILSFMCETHINIDGRYDKNRGLVDSTSMSPQNFNQINPIYSLQDNYFTAKKLDTEDVDLLNYPNQVVFSKTKISGADVDLWTNVTLLGTLELDGDKGEIRSLQRLNNQLISFQDNGISQILFNETMQMASTEGSPIELANSGKVEGKRYFSNTIGCSNKWSICNTPAGIYFMDSHDKSIYLFNGLLQSLSDVGGFNTWSKKNIAISAGSWTPLFNTVSYDDTRTPFIAHYDRLNQDILWINKDTALAWNEKLQVFTSFYDYGNTPWFCNLEDTGIWITSSGTLWKHQAGEYCRFFDVNRPFWMTLIGNPEPLLDKTFTNLEFRSSVEGEGEGLDGSGNTGLDVFDYTFDYTFHPSGGSSSRKYVPYIPFDYLETWNEYQHGIANLGIRNGHSAALHHTGLNASLHRKFRIWRCDIPRNNYPMSKNRYGVYIPENDYERGIYRKAMRPTDRMRNPWLYLKLQKNASNTPHKTEIHDIVMSYFV